MVRAPFLLALAGKSHDIACVNRYKCKFCGKDVEADAPCCEEYKGPKSNSQQATKTRVTKAMLQGQSKIVNMHLEGAAGSMVTSD